MPESWKEALAAVAYAFHFPPSELWAMELEELEFWLERARWINEQVNRGR